MHRSTTSILVVSRSPQDYHGAGGRTRVVSEIQLLRQQGLEVTLLCLVPPRRYLRWRRLAKARQDLQAAISARVIYLPRLPLVRIAMIAALDRLLCGLVVLVTALATGAQVLHCHGPSAAGNALLARRLRPGLRVVADIHGATPEEHAYAAGGQLRPEVLAALDRRERQVLHEADWVIYVSQALLRHVQQKHGLQRDSYSIIPCLTEDRPTSDVTHREALRRQLGIADRLVLVYLGSVRAYQLLDQTLSLFRQIHQHRDDAFLLLLSSFTGELRRMAATAGLSEEDYAVRSVPHHEVFELLPVADLGLLLRDSSIVNRVASPTKLAEYLICGVPVLLSDQIGDYSAMIAANQLGHVLTRPELDDRLCRFLDEVSRTRSAYGERCMTYARRHLTWASVRNALPAIYRTVTRPRDTGSC